MITIHIPSFATMYSSFLYTRCVLDLLICYTLDIIHCKINLIKKFLKAITGKKRRNQI